jgi:hypothetical protein
MRTPGEVLAGLWREPVELLVRRWNWKSALCSSICRATIFFVVNSSAGMEAAGRAMAVEFVYRALTAGFYGALTQSFRQVEPKWKAMASAAVLLVGVSHSIEFLLHWARGTPNLAASMAASMAFTLVTTVFNLHAMRRGLLVTGGGGYGLWTDLRMLPTLFRPRA